DYSWVKIDGDLATLGVNRQSAEKVKEFVFIDLPQVGQNIKKGEKYVSLEAVKWSGHLSAPLSGEVVEVNEELFDEPNIINSDPYNKGWICRLKISNEKEIKELLKAQEMKNDG
ncbi:MAG TPA: glycine cleavage system protein GcvH, partial [Candidatus Vogelbacteria bacterium]|nr:glycine cleavage system protein GcvH [Candidatus Vogelbacteria bacterium]